MVDFIKANLKAIIAFVATFLAGHFGLEVPVDVQLALVAFVVALLTWLFPNKTVSE
jgi:hypothetical protein